MLDAAGATRQTGRNHASGACDVLDRILLTNDDGIDAPGMAMLEADRRADRARSVGGGARARPERLVPRDQPAPRAARQPSAVERRFGITGTPGDCAAMGICHLMTDGAAATGAVRRQPRAEPGDGDGVLRHRRRRDDRR